MAADADLRGTLGLPALFGRIAVIDYPGRRFCLFDEADLPPVLARATYVRAMLRGDKFFVPIRSGGFASNTIVFDTGSSEIPLHVDLAVWKRLTGRATADAAPVMLGGGGAGADHGLHQSGCARILRRLADADRGRAGQRVTVGRNRHPRSDRTDAIRPAGLRRDRATIVR